MLVAGRLHRRAAQQGIKTRPPPALHGPRRDTSPKVSMTAEKRLDITRKSASYWNVVIGNPPTNMFDPLMFAELNVLVEDMA